MNVCMHAYQGQTKNLVFGSTIKMLVNKAEYRKYSYRLYSVQGNNMATVG